MRKTNFKLYRLSLETIYIAFIRPSLERGDIIKRRSQNSYWNHKISFSLSSLFRKTMEYFPAKTK